jgi:hypothetical protein
VLLPIMSAPLTVTPTCGGTTGTAPTFITIPCGPTVEDGLVDSCANVEVWFPSRNMLMAPSRNDPNASVTFVITSPSGNDGNCGIRKYHYSPFSLPVYYNGGGRGDRTPFQ